jgi:hypothetical protein
MNDPELTFYMQLCYTLLKKYCNHHATFTLEEFEEVVGKHFIIKHRINKDNIIEVMAVLDEH